MSSTDNTGLGLFDDAASAVGNFPTALRGYDRTAVDDYVRTLEASVVQSRRRATQLEQQVAALQDQVAASTDKSSASDLDYSNLGGRANDILRLAQEQARELVENATIEAEKVKENARREADSLRSTAAREGDAIKTGGVAEIDQLREQAERRAPGADREVQGRGRSRSLPPPAGRRSHSAAKRTTRPRPRARTPTSTPRTCGVPQSARRPRSASRWPAEREQAVAQLKQAHDQAQSRTAELLAEATKHHDQSAERLEADIAEAARIRADAMAEAEQAKEEALRESDARIATAKKQATAISERTQQEFTWRKQQLRRETELLHQRKQAVLSQLASLSALAEQTANAFPDLDDPADLEGDEPGDATVLRSGTGGPDQGDNEIPPTTRRPRRWRSAPARTPKPAAEGKNGGSRGGSGSSKPVPQPEPEVDGDATVLISSNDMPAGTQHLSGRKRLDPGRTNGERRAGRDGRPAAASPIACRERGDHLSTPFLGDCRDLIPARRNLVQL